MGNALVCLDDGDETGGVTGALFEILRGGREEGIPPFLRKGKMVEMLLCVSPPPREGLGNEEDDGLTW